ncbi:MAG: radical SAM protein [Actinomycetota bacterium]|nr:radical SAM protein [Actinomycetota bacterium]
MTVHIDKFIWDLTYACPLRCIHCYSESGRRAARMLTRDDAMRVVDAVIGARPTQISLSGGEPLLVPWLFDVAHRLENAGVSVTVFTSGWVMDEKAAESLAGSVTSVAVSVDGATPRIHDFVRGRNGAYAKVMRTLELLSQVKRDRESADARCYSLGVDYTLTRSGNQDLAQFVSGITSHFPEIDFVRFGAVIPGGLAAEKRFEEQELLTYEELVEIAAAEDYLAHHSKSDAKVTVTDVRYFLPKSPLTASDVDIAQLEADGQLRAVPIYEAKVGSVLNEPLDVLWEKAHAWRVDPFVVDQIQSIKSVADWARVTRTLDRRFGSTQDQERIARRN